MELIRTYRKSTKVSSRDEYLKYSLPSHILFGLRTYQNEECEIVFGEDLSLNNAAHLSGVILFSLPRLPIVVCKPFVCMCVRVKETW